MEIKRPSLFLHLTEIFRAIYERFIARKFMKDFPDNNIGNNQAIMVIPGLLSSDFTTKMLRNFLSKIGFEVSGWNQGRNLGNFDKLKLVIDQTEEMVNRKNQKIILIGWSMGGIFAREIAKARPDLVKKVITVGSPFANTHAPNWAKWVFDLLNDESKLDPTFVANIPAPPPLPTLALYSKLDGIVPWQACMDIVADELHRNIEVKSSHFGMGSNAQVMAILAQELQHEEQLTQVRSL